MIGELRCGIDWLSRIRENAISVGAVPVSPLGPMRTAVTCWAGHVLHNKDDHSTAQINGLSQVFDLVVDEQQAIYKKATEERCGKEILVNVAPRSDIQER